METKEILARWKKHHQGQIDRVQNEAKKAASDFEEGLLKGVQLGHENALLVLGYLEKEFEIQETTYKGLA